MAPPRTTVIAVADTYLQGGLVGHDPSKVLLAPDCVRAENGWDTGRTEEISAQFPLMTMCLGIRNLYWLVEGHDAVARYDLILDGAGELAVIEYFRVGPRGIEQIAGSFSQPGRIPNALGPADTLLREIRSRPRSGKRSATVKAAVACFLAVTSDPASAPLGPDISVAENGTLVAAGVRGTLTHFGAGLWTGIREAQVLQWIAEGDEAVGRFELRLTDNGVVVGSIYLRLFAGLVREIQLTYGDGPSADLLTELNGGPSSS